MNKIGTNRLVYIGIALIALIATIMSIVAITTDVMDFGMQYDDVKSPWEAMDVIYGTDGNPAELDSHVGYLFIGTLLSILISVSVLAVAGVMIWKDQDLKPVTTGIIGGLAALAFAMAIASLVVSSDLNDFDWFMDLEFS